MNAFSSFVSNRIQVYRAATMEILYNHHKNNVPLPMFSESLWLKVELPNDRVEHTGIGRKKS